jgi:hypothetical protein
VDERKPGGRIDDEVDMSSHRSRSFVLQDGAVDPEPTVGRGGTYHGLIAPYVIGAEGERSGSSFLGSDSDFEAAIHGGTDAMAPHVVRRHEAVAAAL